MRALLALVAFASATAFAAGVAHESRPDFARPQKAELSIGAAVAPDGTLWVVGLNPGARLYVQSSADLGRTWTAPRQLDIGTDKVAADGENRPKIAFGPERLVVVSYTQPLARPYTGEIRMLRSTDGGASFSAPFTVHRDRQVITHRFESMAFDARGTLHTVWIDKRDQVVAARNAGNGPGPAGYRGAAIYRNESRDGGLSFGADTKLADHSCECCRIALTPTPRGSVAVMWRHVFEPSIRDHAVAFLGEGGAPPVRATFDNWRLDACPHHGPGLAPARTGGYHAVWFGERNGRAAVRYGRLASDGTPRDEARELPDPHAEHADVASAGTSVVVAWRSYDGTQTRLRAWVSANDGASFALRELAASPEQNDHPRLVVTTSAILVIWRTASTIHVVPFPS